MRMDDEDAAKEGEDQPPMIVMVAWAQRKTALKQSLFQMARLFHRTCY